MAFTTGTATDYYDLLSKLHTYLALQGWTVNEWVDGGSVASISRLTLTAPGNVGGQQPKMSFQTSFDTVANAYTWEVTAYPLYDPALGFGLQNNSSPIVHFCLWPNTIDYWVYVNNTRVIVVAKIGVYYISMYAGFFLPYALPAEYPYPYYIGATFRSAQPYNLDNAGMRCFADPGYYSAYYMTREALNWQFFVNSYEADNAIDSYSSTDGGVVWPFRAPPNDSNNVSFNDMGNQFFNAMRPLIGGKMPMFQLQLIDAFERCAVGTLDNVFATGGFNRVAEQLVAIGVDNYRLFININRNTPKGFFAILEE